MTRALLFYGHVASNWGDLAINAGAVELMRRSGIDVEDSTAVLLGPSDHFRRQASFTLKGMTLSTLPADGTQRGGREEIELLIDYIAYPHRFAEAIGMAEYDLVVLNAGEHLFESATGENLVDLVWRILPGLAAQSIGVRTVLLPSTIGPFRTEFGARIDDFVRRGLGAAAYRERESLRLASAKDTAADNKLPVLLDPGFFVTGLRPREAEGRERYPLGIVLRPEDMGIRPGSRRSTFVQQKFRESEFRGSRAFRLFAAVAEGHLAADGTVKIIVQTRADREISQALADYLTEANGPGRVELVDPQGFREYLGELGTLGAVVTSRFHTVILAAAQGVPCVGVYSETHGHKMPGLFELLKFPSYAVRLDERTIDVVRAEVVHALEAARSSIDEINNRIRANRTLTRRWFDEAVSAPLAAPIDTAELRIDALALLYRQGLDRQERESLGEVLRALREEGSGHARSHNS